MEIANDYIGCLKHLAVNSEYFTKRKTSLPPEDSYYNPFLRDRLAIQDSKALRRLGEKTQVFTQHPNPHIRSRLTHVTEVCTTSVRIAQLTGLDTYLSETISYGHDMGHTPFGHLGEKVLSQITGLPFRHEIFGTIVAQEIEREGKGLNLTRGTLLGMRWHSGWNQIPKQELVPLEARAVMVADKIAYTFADVNDVARLKFGDVETMIKMADQFGSTQRKRVTVCIHALVAESAEAGTLSFEHSDVAQKFAEFRRWMYGNVYLQYDPFRKHQEIMLYMVYDFILKHKFFEGCNPAVVLALMTDREIERLVEALRNNGNLSKEDLYHYSFSEIISSLKSGKIDFTQPSLV